MQLINLLCIAEKMIDKFQERFESNDFSKNSDNCFKRLTQDDIDTEEKIGKLEAEMGEDGKSVFTLVTDSEQLPFPDETFDSYTSNLCLQITPNYMDMLKKSYSVLKPGGKAAFSVWGREEK